MKKQFLRAVVEIGFISLLFYSNLLMGKYDRSGLAHTRGLVWALEEIVTPSNLVICIVAGLTGYVVVEFLRRMLL
jgi:hypothetical protein